MININMIKTNSLSYVSIGTSQYHSDVPSYLFNGKKPKTTHHPMWFEVDKEISTLDKIMPEKRSNKRYERKDEFESVDEAKYPRTAYEDEDGEFNYPYAMYDVEYDITPGYNQPMQFNINVIAEINDFDETKTTLPINNYLIDKIMYEPILLPTRPCFISSHDLYNIIRSYIKTNLNGKYATITSDYDFYFKVEKRLELPEEEEVTYYTDIFRKKGPIKKTKMVRFDTKPIYSIVYTDERGKLSHSVKGSTAIKEMSAENQLKLKDKLDNYLKELIQYINEPLKCCEHCNGLGAVICEAPAI